MDDRAIERAYRNRASLSPAQRAEVERLHAEMVQRNDATWRDGGPPLTNEPESRLDGAPSNPMPVEPALGPMQGPRRNRSRADWATDAATGGGLYSPGENVESMDVTDVPSPGEVGNAQRTLYHRDRRLAERGAGPMPEDALEPEATTRDRYDRQFGPGAYERDAAGRASRGGGRTPTSRRARAAAPASPGRRRPDTG